MVNSIKKGGGSGSGPLSLRSLNHITLVCTCLKESIRFYEEILGFVLVKRPASFGFDGAWLSSYGISIHLLQSRDPDHHSKKTEINPRDNHISFQCDDVKGVERKLQEMNVKYVKRIVEEEGFMWISSSSMILIAIWLSSATVRIFQWSQSWGLHRPKCEPKTKGVFCVNHQPVC